MNPTGNNKTFKILTAVLVLLLVGLGAYTIKFYNSVQDNVREVVRKKEVIALELRDILHKYEEQQTENNALRKQLTSAQTRITRLLDSLTYSENTREVLRNYRREILDLRNQRDLLFQKNDSLARLTVNLENENSTVKKAFDSSVVERDSLRKQNAVLQQQLNTKAALKLHNLKAQGVIVRRSGKHLANTLAKRIDNIEICYELKANFISPGINLYTQVIAPSNNVLGERNTITFGKKTLIYSAREQPDTTSTYYNTSFCQLIPSYEEKFNPGIYHINIFKGDSLMASTLLQLD